MSKKIKNQFSNTTFLYIIALVAFMGFLLAACAPMPVEKTVTGTVIADTKGTVQFMYSRLSSDYPNACILTTNLPAPNDQFVLTIISGSTSEHKVIENLTSGQKVEWTAKVEGNPLNYGSGNFVHIIND